jgi:hypothetical protein
MKRYFLFLFVLIAPCLAIAQPPDSLWSHIYGGSGWETCNSVQQTSDGGYILAGYTDSYGAGYDDFWVVKTDANGDTLWTRTYGGDNMDACQALEQTSDGGYILAGFSRSFAPFDKGWIVRTDANGDTLWTRVFYQGNYFTSVQQTPDGGFILAGSEQTGDYNFWLVRTDSSGVELWSRRYGGTDNEYCQSVQQTSDGGFVLAGYTRSFGAGNEDYWLLKTAANGDSLWSQTFGISGQEYCYSVAQTSDGGYVLMGTAEGFGGLQDFWLVRTDANGDSLWSRVYGGGDNDPGKWAHQTWDGGFILAGYTGSYGAGYFDFWLIRTDENGDTLWTATYGDVNHEYCNNAAQTSDGGYIMVGRTNGFGAESSDFWVLKTERDPLLAPPDSFNLISPANGNTLTLAEADFVWQAAPDPDPNDNIIYCLYISTDSTFATADSVCSLSDTTYHWQGLSDDEQYWWKVKAINDFGIFTWSDETWNFAVSVPEVPSAFNLLAPQNGSLLEPGPTSFIWESSIDPDPGDIITYTLHFVTETDSVSYTIGTDTTADVNPDTVDVLEPGGDATWYVTAHSTYPDTMIESAQRFTFTASAAEVSAHLPTEFRLYQNYPNPFNPTTTIRFDLPRASVVTLRIFDLLGREVLTLVDENRAAGSHNVTFDGSRLASGIYLYRLQAGPFTTTKKMVLLK